MAIITNLDGVSKETSLSWPMRAANECLCILAGIVYVLFLPFLVISCVFCMSADSLVHSLSGKHLMKFRINNGYDDIGSSTDSAT